MPLSSFLFDLAFDHLASLFALFLLGIVIPGLIGKGLGTSSLKDPENGRHLRAGHGNKIRILLGAFTPDLLTIERADRSTGIKAGVWRSS